MINFLSFLRSKMFLKNLAIAFGLALGIFIVLFIYLRIFTHHNRSIAVPDLSDLPVADAEILLVARDLRFEIFDSMYVADREPGVIIDQHPAGGKNVKKSRKVYLTINANSPENILMPDLVGITLREARAKIQIAGLNLGKLFYRYNIGKNVVLEQQFKLKIIGANDTIMRGATIDLVLGKGLSNERSMVPDLLGLTESQAKAKASETLFTIHSAVPDNTVRKKDTLMPFVFRQDPIHHPDVLVPLGKEIIIWMTTDSTKLPGADEADSTYVWPPLNEADDEEISEDDTYNPTYN